ncbi:MAG: hypothetical protein FWH16_03160 [Oscillospiraceae bacterium]|nr:hypothetical protein [Oscillospiraceae bacterium]
MDFVRQIVDSSLLDKIILPHSMRNKKVEVIVLPLNDDKTEGGNGGSIDNFVGILEDYRDISLIPMEKHAWAEAAEEKHASY